MLFDYAGQAFHRKRPALSTTSSPNSFATEDKTGWAASEKSTVLSTIAPALLNKLR
jgi:hypothetical protein